MLSGHLPGGETLNTQTDAYFVYIIEAISVCPERKKRNGVVYTFYCSNFPFDHQFNVTPKTEVNCYGNAKKQWSDNTDIIK